MMKVSNNKENQPPMNSPEPTRQSPARNLFGNPVSQDDSQLPRKPNAPIPHSPLKQEAATGRRRAATLEDASKHSANTPLQLRIVQEIGSPAWKAPQRTEFNGKNTLEITQSLTERGSSIETYSYRDPANPTQILDSQALNAINTHNQAALKQRDEWLDERDTLIALQQTSINTLEADNKRLLEKIQDLDSKIQDLEAAKTELESDIAQMSNDRVEALAKLDAELEFAKGGRQALEAELQAVNTQLKTAHSEIEQLTQELTEANNLLNPTLTALGKAQEELESEKAAHAANLKNYAAQANKSIKVLQESLAIAQTERTIAYVFSAAVVLGVAVGGILYIRNRE